MLGKDAKKAVFTGAYVVRTLTRILIYVGACMLILKLAVSAFEFGYDVFGSTAKTTPDRAVEITLTVEEEDSVKDVGKKLKENGLIDNPYVFVVQEKLYASSKDEIRPGTYTLDTSQNVEAILQVLFGNEDEEEK